jgi:hypothetical protein
MTAWRIGASFSNKAIPEGKGGNGAKLDIVISKSHSLNSTTASGENYPRYCPTTLKNFSPLLGK